ncbi:TPA: hypothetical protein NKU35_003447 [Vibrio parahaemolyticus]|nr:hypothetical protein [Vibrio parahaemolyticus]HCH5494715.1 hypothetical protein [Vibrio parahaemolyticus]HCH6275978.1 hypothetical protein [Vibrio parahaemolyticus]HCH6312397.1 hypothetical protein [Vibrio parahaemolyticus]HCH6482983.1 hypothetical protein [Vibrio parahaemolyticus]
MTDTNTPPEQSFAEKPTTKLSNQKASLSDYSPNFANTTAGTPFNPTIYVAKPELTFAAAIAKFAETNPIAPTLPLTKITEIHPLSIEALRDKGKKRKNKDYYLSVKIGIDMEYEEIGEGKNKILSIQSCLVANGEECTDFDRLYNGKRRQFKATIKRIIRKAIKEGVIDRYPDEIIVCAHFMRADLMHFENAFNDFDGYLSAVRKTVIDMESNYGIDIELTKAQKEKLALEKVKVTDAESKAITGHSIRIYDEQRNYHHIKIKFYDTMLLAPTGQSLEAIGELLGLEKIKLPEGYTKDRMGEFLENEPELFEQYAIRDAIIAVRYFEKYCQFCEEEGLSGRPYTVGGVALNLYKESVGQDLPKLFGQTQLKKEIYNETTGKFRTIKSYVSTDDKIISEEFVKRTYHGGVNSSHQIGPTAIRIWSDIDIKSCYTAILNNLRNLNYAKSFMSTNLDDFLHDIMGFARVEFSFPEDTQYPCLPVRTDKYGLVYPLEGESWCTAHELVVAKRAGATISIKQGVIIPWAEDGEYVFRDFMKHVRQQRNYYKSIGNVFYEKLWKEIGNSLYGKLAQGLRSNKTGYDIFLQYSKKLPPSAITNAYFASYTTGLARALMFEQIHSIAKTREINNITTDGYATTASLEDVDTSGPISQIFRKSFAIMNGESEEDTEILEVKHRVQQMIAMKTRGQLTSIAIEGEDPILAKAGIQTHVQAQDYSRGSDVEQNDYMLDLYLNRYPGQTHTRKSLNSTRQQFTHQTDLVAVETEQRLNLEHDFKRDLVNPKIRTVRYKKNGEMTDTPHIHLDTKPFRTIEDMLFARVRFDEWRKTHTLKTIEDWDNWQEYYLLSKSLVETNMRLQSGEHSGHVLLRLFLRAYGQSELGLCGDEYSRKELVSHFAEWGYSYKPNDFTPAKKAKMFLGVVPRTQLTMELAGRLTELLPAFDVEQLFYE